MAYVKVSGDPVNEHLGGAKPAWLDTVDGGATITWGASQIDISSGAASNWGFIVSHAALDALPAVKLIRVKARWNSYVDLSYPVYSAIVDSAAQPTDVGLWDYNVCEPNYYDQCHVADGGISGRYLNDLSLNPGAGSSPQNTWRLYDYYWDTSGVLVYWNIRSATDGSVIYTANHSYAYTNGRWWGAGITINYALGQQDFSIDYIQFLTDKNVNVGTATYPVESGYVAKLYDASNTLLATGAASDGTASVIDATALQTPGGLTGYFKIFNGAAEVRRMPLSGTFTGFYQGDTWPGIDVSPKAQTFRHHFSSPLVCSVNTDAVLAVAGTTTAYANMQGFTKDVTGNIFGNSRQLDCGGTPVEGLYSSTWEEDATGAPATATHSAAENKQHCITDIEASTDTDNSLVTVSDGETTLMSFRIDS